MKLEVLHISPLAVHVTGGNPSEWSFLGRISSLIMVAKDCGVRSITWSSPAPSYKAQSSVWRRLIESNGIIQITDVMSGEGADEDIGFYVLCRDVGFILLRDADDENRYSIFMTAISANVDLSSRCAYLIADILGFSSLVSYEVRLSVYELLNNVVEHNLEDGYRQWIKLAIGKNDGKLEVTIIDRGMEFDPTGGERQFDLDQYLRRGKWRGLGLVLTRKIAERMIYSRTSGFNRLIFEKSVPHHGNGADMEKEGEMEQFSVSDPVRREDGSYELELAGDLDTKGALVMEDLMFQLIERKMFNVVLDFMKVPFVSSAGVGILLGMVSTLREEGGNVSLRNISPKVRSVFRLLNLDDFFTILDQGNSVVQS